MGRDIEAARLIFIDETWNQDQYGSAQGLGADRQRVKAKVPRGDWKTTTFLAALRCNRVDALWLIDVPRRRIAFSVMVHEAAPALCRQVPESCTGSLDHLPNGRP